MPLAPLPGLRGLAMAASVTLRLVVRALPTGPVMVAAAVSLRLRASVRATFLETLSLTVRDAFAASVSLPLATVFLPCLRASLPLSANAYGFVVVTVTARLARPAAPAIVTLGPVARIS